MQMYLLEDRVDCGTRSLVGNKLGDGSLYGVLRELPLGPESGEEFGRRE